MFTRDVNINIITTILILLQFEYSPALGTATTITCVSFVSLSFLIPPDADGWSTLCVSSLS